MTPSIENASSATASTTPTFSYAQAAKGLTSTGTSTTSSRVASSAITPAKDAVASPIIPSQLNPAKELDSLKIKDVSVPKPAAEHQESIPSNSVPTAQAHPVANESTNPPSPTYVDSSVSTLPREDDSSSVNPASSESTWENVSTASHVAERGTEIGDQELHNEKGEKDWVKIPKQEQEAPMPIVNVWKQRMEAQAPVKKPLIEGLGVTTGPVHTEQKKADQASKFPRGKEQDILQPQKRDQRGDEESNKPRRSSAKKFSPEEKPQVALPSLQDQNIWPTVDIGVTLDDRKRPQDTAKAEKEKPLAKGKKQWNTMDIQPSIVFQTPIHNPGARRGGRGGSRGGRDVNSRSSPGAANRLAEKRIGSPNAGEFVKREREGAPRSTSPKGKRAVSDEASSRKESRYNNRENKDSANQESRTDGKLEDKANGQTSAHHTFPRNSFNKPNRRPEIPNGDSEKRKDSKIQSDLPNGESSMTDDISVPKTAQTPQDEDKKGSNNAENTSRNFGRGHTQAFASRSRGSVRGRGGHSFQPNGSPHFQHQFGLVRSPTMTHEQYFAAGNRTQSRNGARNQSLPPDTYNNRFGPMQTGMVAPINTYMGQPNAMYDFSGQPMSAVSYQPYLEQYQKMGSVSVQLEFYFTVDNLCRDIFLRKQMDSKGFVLLSTIASFNRIKTIIDGDYEILRNVSQQSHNIEYRLGVDGHDRIRKRYGWESFVLPDKTQRDESARHDGVEAQTPRATGWPNQMPFNTMASPMSPNQPMSAFVMPSQGFGDFSRVPNGDMDFRYQMTPPMMNQQFQAAMPMENQGYPSPSKEYPPNGMTEGPASIPNGHPKMNGAMNGFQLQQNGKSEVNGVSSVSTGESAAAATETNGVITQ